MTINLMKTPYLRKKMRSICRGLDHLKYTNIKSGHRTDIQSCVFIFRPKQWQIIMIIIQAETKPHMKKENLAPKLKM